MTGDEVYRHIVVHLASVGIVAPKLSDLPSGRDYSEAEASRLAREVADYIEAKIKCEKE